jgi:hypothetical protein
VITTLNPTAAATNHGPAGRLSPRSPSLSGHVVGIVWNRLGHSDLLFDALVNELAATDQIAGVVKVAKPSQSVPPTAHDWDRLKASTVALCGFGGCGSCSARSMRDAIELDWQGIPSVWVGHRAVEASARAIARLVGVTDYPMVFTTYPYVPTASWTHEEALTLARELAPAVRHALTGGVS